MEEIVLAEGGNKKAIIIAIEDYRKSRLSINSVRYAKNDALRFKDVLINHYGYSENDIIVLIDQDAVKSAFDNDIRYEISQLSPEDEFIFYYAGHGFYQDGHNKLTCWDSHPSNLSETTVSINGTVLQPLQESGCRRSLIFLDCCSVSLKATLSSRDVLSDMNLQEFETFINTSEYNAVFMSCSPGEKSHSCDNLQHGIWTWHLLEALSGNQESAFVDDIFITNASLQNYLSYSVPRYITHQTAITATQHPYAKIQAANDFLIKKFERPDVEIDKSLPDFRLKYEDAVFRKIDSERIKSASGFKPGHKTPKWRNSSATHFVQSVFKPEINDEIQQVYEKTKKVCNLKKSDIEYSADSGEAYLSCPIFRYNIEVDLDENDFTKAKFIRRLQVRVSRGELPAEFDSIFPIYADELIIPIEGNLDFDDLVNKFENLSEAQGGTLTDNAAMGTMEYITEGGTSITIDVGEKELIITHYSPMRTVALIDKSIEDLKRISSHKIKLLN